MLNSPVLATLLAQVTAPTAADEVAAPTFAAGAFTTPGQTITARVRLAGDRWYALAILSTPPGLGERLDATVTGADRRVLATVHGEGEHDAGAGFRAPKTGIYTLTFTDAGGGRTYPWLFQWRVVSDCPEGDAAGCTLKLGKAQQRLLAWAGDGDQYRVRLTPGGRYTLTLTAGLSPYVEVLAKSGAILAQGHGHGQGIFDPLVIQFTAGAQPTFVRVVGRDEAGGPYTIMITRP